MRRRAKFGSQLSRLLFSTNRILVAFYYLVAVIAVIKKNKVVVYTKKKGASSPWSMVFIGSVHQEGEMEASWFLVEEGD